MTDEEEAVIQVISALVIFRSSPTNEVMTVVDPIRKELIETAIVVVKTKSTVIIIMCIRPSLIRYIDLPALWT